MRLTALIAAFAALALPALGELAMTSPVASTTCTGGQRCNVAWSDNGKQPTLAQQGNCTFALYTGSRNQQTFLQPIAFPNSVDVSKTSSIDFTVNPTVGENGNNYFIRASSVSLKDGTSPYLSFSALFTLSGMTGTFNQTVKNQIQGATSTSAPTANPATDTGTTNTGTTNTGTTNTGTTNTGTTARSSSSRSSSSNSSSSSRSVSTAAVGSANGTGAAFVNASPITYTGVAAFIGAVVGLAF